MLRARTEASHGVLAIWLPIYLGAGAVGVLLAALLSAPGQSLETGTPTRGDIGLSKGSGPFVYAHEIALGGLNDATSLPVSLPQSEVANAKNVSHVWVTDDEGVDVQRVAIEFANREGTVTVIWQPQQYEDARAEFQAFVKEGHATATILEASQSPILVISPGTDSLKSNPAYVEVAQNGVDVNLYSDDYQVDELVAAVRSILKESGTDG